MKQSVVLLAMCIALALIIAPVTSTPTHLQNASVFINQSQHTSNLTEKVHFLELTQSELILELMERGIMEKNQTVVTPTPVPAKVAVEPEFVPGPAPMGVIQNPDGSTTEVSKQ